MIAVQFDGKNSVLDDLGGAAQPPVELFSGWLSEKKPGQIVSLQLFTKVCQVVS